MNFLLCWRTIKLRYVIKGFSNWGEVGRELQSFHLCLLDILFFCCILVSIMY